MNWLTKDGLFINAEKKREALAFLAWAEKTHPAYLNNLKDGYRRHKEASQ
tara:strand:- start:541 stop:690 length:150 start_codon:yes stop_codon:yes gene_type:complete